MLNQSLVMKLLLAACLLFNSWIGIYGLAKWLWTRLYQLLLIRQLCLCIMSVVFSWQCYMCRIPSLSFFGWRYWIWYGYSLNLKDKGGVSRQDDAHILCLPISQSIWYCCGALQCNIVCPSARGKCRWVHGSRQWSSLWYLLQDT